MMHGDCKSYCRACELTEQTARKILGAAAVPVLRPVNGDMFPETRSKPEDDPDTRFTPREYVMQLHAANRYTIDLASCAESPAAQIIGRFWTKADDALSRSWDSERGFLNCPWSEIARWTEKCWYEMAHGCELIDSLLPAWTDRAWWHKDVEPFRDGGLVKVPGVRLTSKFLPRMRFGHPGNPNAVSVEQPEFWCVLLSWRRT